MGTAGQAVPGAVHLAWGDVGERRIGRINTRRCHRDADGPGVSRGGWKVVSPRITGVSACLRGAGWQRAEPNASHRWQRMSGGVGFHCTVKRNPRGCDVSCRRNGTADRTNTGAGVRPGTTNPFRWNGASEGRRATAWCRRRGEIPGVQIGFDNRWSCCLYRHRNNWWLSARWGISGGERATTWKNCLTRLGAFGYYRPQWIWLSGRLPGLCGPQACWGGVWSWRS